MSEAERMLPAEPLRRFKPYPAYKDSGIEWLREVPAHWEESKVKFLGTYVNGYPFKPEDWSAEGLPIIRIQNLTDLNASFNRFAGNVDLRYRVRKGDILISWSASLGLFVWTRDEDAWLNQHIFKVQLSESRITRDFFVWLGTWFIRELQKETHGSTMTHLTWGRFGGFRVEIPSDPEQRAIAAFLDRETAKIATISDTSTSDTVIALASGLAGNKAITAKGQALDAFTKALTEVCGELAYQIVKDGEGATKVFRVSIQGAKSVADADRVGYAITGSPLVKTAVHGADPNWGRLAAAIGRSGAAVDPMKLTITIGGVTVFKKGVNQNADLAPLEAHMKGREISFDIHLGLGKHAAQWLGCDLSKEYVAINADYST